MGAVVLLVGKTMADVLGGIGRSYRPAFEALGHQFVEIDLIDTATAPQKLNSLVDLQIDLVLSFMGMGADITATQNGRPGIVWEFLQVPFISLCGDSPAYFFDRHVFTGKGFVCLYGFPEHYAFRKRLPKINVPIGTYLPTAHDVAPKESMDFRRKADGDIIFLKNGKDLNKQLALWKTLPPKINSMLQEVAAELRARVNDKAATQVDDLLTAYAETQGIDLGTMPKLRLFLVAMLDDYLRQYKTHMLIEALMDFPIILNGYNWDHLDFTGRRMQYIPGGQYTASIRMLRDALACVDVSPNTELAPHDRPLRAFGAHTLCLTNEQEFLRTHLPHGDDFMYRFDADSIRERVNAVYGNRARAVELGAEVAGVFQAKFPAENFARQMLDWAQLVRFNNLTAAPQGVPGYCVWPPDSFRPNA